MEHGAWSMEMGKLKFDFIDNKDETSHPEEAQRLRDARNKLKQ